MKHENTYLTKNKSEKINRKLERSYVDYPCNKQFIKKFLISCKITLCIKQDKFKKSYYNLTKEIQEREKKINKNVL